MIGSVFSQMLGLAVKAVAEAHKVIRWAMLFTTDEQKKQYEFSLEIKDHILMWQCID